jgi:hypothetical protein
MKAVQHSDEMLLAKRQILFHREFTGITAAEVTFTAASGTIDAEDGGGTSLLTQASDNAIAHWTTVGKMVQVAAGRPVSFASQVKFTEANTDDANVLVGLHSGAVGSALGNNGAGPPASYSGFAFFKADGATLWSVEASLAGAQVTAELSASNTLTKRAYTAGGTKQLLEINVNPKTSTKADVMFLIDGVCVYKVLDWTYTSIAAMAGVGVVKAGSANAEKLITDFVSISHIRGT